MPLTLYWTSHKGKQGSKEQNKHHRFLSMPQVRSEALVAQSSSGVWVSACAISRLSSVWKVWISQSMKLRVFFPLKSNFNHCWKSLIQWHVSSLDWQKLTFSFICKLLVNMQRTSKIKVERPQLHFRDGNKHSVCCFAPSQRSVKVLVRENAPCCSVSSDLLPMKMK